MIQTAQTENFRTCRELKSRTMYDDLKSDILLFLALTGALAVLMSVGPFVCQAQT